MTKYPRVIILTIFTLAMLVSNAFADVLNIKSDAPKNYTVEKGDTLWDISKLFLDKPWLWPELWRHNTQIENPHLIYPGDMLRLRYENGVPVIDIVREKSQIVLSPSKRILSKPEPIAMLPWDSIAAFYNNDSIMDAKDYQALPTLLGDNKGTPRFTSQDYVLAHKMSDTQADYQVVRKERDVVDSNGRLLGLQVSRLSDATISNHLTKERQVVRLTGSSREAKQGDKLLPTPIYDYDDLVIVAATKTQTGELVQNVNGNILSGKNDMVVINLGKRAVKPGTVFGVYSQGEDVVFEEQPSYTQTRSSIVEAFTMTETVEQPAYKIGEIIVVRTFENASYAWVTQASTHLRGGEFVAAP